MRCTLGLLALLVAGLGGCAELGDNSAQVEPTTSVPVGGAAMSAPGTPAGTGAEPMDSGGAGAGPTGQGSGGTDSGGLVPPDVGADAGTAGPTGAPSTPETGSGTATGSTGECQSSADCGGTRACVAPFGNPPTCFDTCNDDSECAGGGSRCVAGNEISGFGVSVCSHDCDPSTSVGCDAGQGCDIYATDATMTTLYTDCRPAGALQLGAACDPTMPASCAASTYCASGTTSTGQSFQSCLKWCDLSLFNCPPGYSCLRNEPPAIVGPREYGLCLPQ